MLKDAFVELSQSFLKLQRGPVVPNSIEIFLPDFLYDQLKLELEGMARMYSGEGMDFGIIIRGHIRIRRIGYLTSLEKEYGTKT